MYLNFTCLFYHILLNYYAIRKITDSENVLLLIMTPIVQLLSLKPFSFSSGLDDHYNSLFHSLDSFEQVESEILLHPSLLPTSCR